jgi:putative ABC transport system permease protein
MFSDVKFAARLLLKHPGFTIVATLVLALGVGANTAIFSVVDAVLLRPLPFADQERIVSIQNLWRNSGLRGQASAPDFHDWHDQARSFDAMAAYVGGQTSVNVGGAADYAVVTRATPEFFPLFGVHAELGRLPSPDEHRDGGPLTAVVSHEFWLTRLGGDRGAIGSTLKFAQRVYTIVGVLPAAFRFPNNTDVWTPWWVFPEVASRSAHNYEVVGHIKRDITVEQAQRDMDAIAGQLERTYPQSNENKGILVSRLLDRTVRDVRGTLTLIFGVVVVVLLIACANVSNLLLARATSRTRELGIRAALGASRTRVVRQLVTESILLAMLAGVASVLVAAWGIRGLVAIAPAGLPRIADVQVDLRVLLFASLVSLAASFVFGIAPALHASRSDLNDVIKQGARTMGAGAGGRLRSSLIVFETAAAVVLVIGAGLLIRSFAALSAVDLGFRSERLLVADTAVPIAAISAAPEAVRFYRALMPQLAAVPGVEAASAVMGVPTRTRSNGGYAIEGGPTFEQMGVRSPQAIFTVNTPGYFATLRVPILKGRDVTDADSETAPLVAVVNEALVRQSFPNGDALGHRIRTGYDGTGFMTIVGIVANMRSSAPSEPPKPQIFMPFQQHPVGSTALNVVVRTSLADPLALGPTISQKVRALNSDVPVRISTMDATIDRAMSTSRFQTLLLALFATVALLLAMAGVYGLVSFTVSQRTSELGLRLALGAQPRAIVALTLSSGLRLTLVGIAIGWIASLAFARLLASMLFATSARDPLIFVAVPLLLLVVAALAAIAPAIRAARVDPVVALRTD